MSWVRDALESNQAGAASAAAPAVEAEQRTGGAPELPPGWNTAETPEGKVYFWNQLTGETSWTRPEGDAMGAFEAGAEDDFHGSKLLPDDNPRGKAFANSAPKRWAITVKGNIPDTPVSDAERKRAARAAAATMHEEKIKEVHGFGQFMDRHERGKVKRTQQDAMDVHGTMELGAKLASKKRPALISDSHKLDLYSWDSSTQVRSGGGRGGNKEAVHHVKAPRALATASMVRRDAATPYELYHELCDNLAATAIEEEKRAAQLA